MILGIVSILKKKLDWGVFLILWAVITIAVASLTRDIPQATRSFFLLVPLTAFAVLGAIDFYNWLMKIRFLSIKLLLILAVGIFIAYNIFYYFASYYFVFPVSYAKQWSQTDEALVSLIVSNGPYKHIIVDANSGLQYTSILFYSAYPPEEFQNSVRRLPDDSVV